MARTTAFIGCLSGALLVWVPATARAEKSNPLEPEAVPVVQAEVSTAPQAPAVSPRVREAPAASFTNSTPITIIDCPSPCPPSGQAASLFPSPIVVTGEVGVVQRVSVTLNGFSHPFPGDVDMLLVSPSGRKSVLMSDFGDFAVIGINVTLDDYADRHLPFTSIDGTPFVTGTYRPANNTTTDAFPAPAPAAPYTYTLSAFNGDTPNGTWSLYIIDDENLEAGSISGGWTITLGLRPPPPGPGHVIISEFRTRGAGTSPPGSDGSADEFIELHNTTNQSITIIDAIPGANPLGPGGAGWRFSAAQGAAENTFFVLPQTLSPNGPLAIPPHGYFLVSTQPAAPAPAGNTYSLTAYPSATGTTPSGTANVSVNPALAAVGFLPDDAGLAVFSTAAALAANRLDSVGYSSVSAPGYREGGGLAPAAGITTAGQHSWTRRVVAGITQDTNDNAADFQLVETGSGILSGVAARLGAPGPQRGPTPFPASSAPIHDPTLLLTPGVIDPLQPADAAPNFVRIATPVANGLLGTMKIRRKYTNSTGHALIALRFRITGISNPTGGVVPAGQADLRVLNSLQQVITLTDNTTITSRALNVQTPAAQPSGGGLNSSLGHFFITSTAPLADGAVTYVEFNFGVMAEGAYNVAISAEGLAADGPFGVSATESFAASGTPVELLTFEVR